MANNMNFDGVGKLVSGEYGVLDIDGVYSCDGDIKAEKITLDGVFSTKGSLEAGVIDADGVADVDGSIKAGELVVDGVVNVKQKIEANEILCNGIVNASREISADVIKADGYVNADEIVGDRVAIFSRIGFFMYLINTTLKTKWSTVKFIEATNIELRGVHATTVNGEHIVIGPKCAIENIDCNGTLFIDKNSTVERITGDYTLTTN